MKKLISFIAAIILIFVLGTAAFAADYYIDEAEMHISFPYDYDIFTRDMDRKVYESYGYSESYEETIAYLEEYGCYFDGYSWDGNSSVMLSVIEDYGMNYNSCTETILTEEMEYLYKFFASDGSYKGIEKEIISVGPNKIIKILFTDPYGNYDIKCFMTHNGDLLILEYMCLPEAYGEEFSVMAEESINSIVFGDVAAAESGSKSEYYVPELGGYVSVLDKYYVMTSEGYDKWYENNFSREEIQGIIDGNRGSDRYLLASSDDMAYDFSVMVTIDSYGFADSKEYFEFAKEYYASLDIEMLSEEVIEIGGIDYYNFKFRRNDNLASGSLYFSVRDGKLIVYNVIVNYGELTERIETELRSMIESTRYSEEAPVEKPSEESDFVESEPVVITDELLGFTMTLPKNWINEESDSEETTGTDIHNYCFWSPENDFITCTAMSVKQFASDITFGFIEFTEEDFANMSKKDYVDILEVPEEDVKCDEFGSETYYYAEKEISGMQMTRAAIIKNGVYYLFSFSGNAENKNYRDFEEFLANVEYAEPTISDKDAAPTETAATMETAINILVALIVAVIFVIVIIVAVVVIIIKKSKKKTAPKAFAPAEEQPVLPEHPEEAKGTFCTACGEKLREGSLFCSNCGTPVNKE